MNLPYRFRFLSACLALASFAVSQNCTAYIGQSETAAAGDWVDSDWFGPFYDAGEGWLHQRNWGWFYQIDGGTESAWIYVPSEGWFWADGNSYPFVYRYASAGWAWFWSDTIDPRLYYDYAGSQWLASDGSDAAVWLSYYEAIIDASVAEPDEISRDLKAIATYNEALPWDQTHTFIKVVSWMPGTYISSYTPGQAISMNWETWVTVAGEARDSAITQGLSLEQAVARMKQALGLTPDKSYEFWVEFWVRPSDLFRPSADPDPSDGEAELDFPDSPESAVSDDYKQWFEGQLSFMYILSREGFPWTRLGYTYDWGNPDDEIGFSEFVIRPGTNAMVYAVYTNAQYMEER